jgi:hypothetical protein
VTCKDGRMDSTRQAVTEHLIVLAHSPDYRERADAGRGLAVFADTPQARDTLVTLILDAGDTYVTRATTEAVLRRRDTVGCGIVARALAVGDDNHADWIQIAIVDVFGIHENDRDAAIRECQTLLKNKDETVRTGVQLLMAALTAITPVLVPHKPT